MDQLENIFKHHQNGKLSIESKQKIDNYETLSIVYTPGVAQVCKKIAETPALVNDYTIINNTVAVITDGSAVLGLGNIGAQAGMPVMEGKAALFKEFAGINAFPILLNTNDVDQIVHTITNISDTFGGINLEDIAAPRCFEIQQRLQQELDIPVFHDDQDGTAVVTLAGLINSLKIVEKDVDKIKIVINGAGAAGTAIFRLLTSYGAKNIILLDRQGAISKNRNDLNEYKNKLAQSSNPNNESGNLSAVISQADLFIGVSTKDVLSKDDVKNMAKDPIIFAMANPDPEIKPELIDGIAKVIATGRSDYPNQINNVLCFPGLFRGLLKHQIKDISQPLLISVAEAIANRISEEKLQSGHVIPEVFDKGVVEDIVQAISNYK